MNELKLLTNDELHQKLISFAQRERRKLVLFLAHLSEADRRKLHADRGYDSLFTYCVKELRYSKGAAFHRVHAARAAERFPEIYSLLAEGLISLRAVALLEPFLTKENSADILQSAQGKSNREIEIILASLAPKPDIADRIRHILCFPATAPQIEASQSFKLEASAPVIATPVLPVRDKVIPLSPQRIQFSFTASEEFLKKMDRIKELLRRKYPSGKLEDIFLEISNFFLQKQDPQLRPRSRGKPPRSRETRRIPQWVRDVVQARDKAKCSFIASGGQRCQARSFLEYDHIIPWALGGKSDDPNNIRLLCHTHNQLASQQIFGEFSKEL